MAPGFTRPKTLCRAAIVGVAVLSTATMMSIGWSLQGAFVPAISWETTTPVGLTATW